VAIAAGVGSDEAIEPEGEQRLLAQSMDEALSSPLLADGRVRYRLRKPWPTPDGAETLVLDPVRFLKRITALMSRPYVNNVRYHGVFANRSKDRPRLPPPPSLISQVPASSAPGPLHNAAADVTPPFEPLPTPTKHRRTPWAQLLKRTLHLDALKCPRCSESMEVLALITDPPVVRNILNHLHLPADDPHRSPARTRSEPSEQMSLEPEPDDEPDDGPDDDPLPSFPPRKRGSPRKPH